MIHCNQANGDSLAMKKSTVFNSVTDSKNTLQIATKLNAPLTVPVQTSLIKSLLVFMPHLVAMIFVIFFVSYPWFVLLFIILSIGISLFYYLRLHLLQNVKKSVLAIYQDSTKNWTIVTANDEQKKPVELQTSSFISPLIVLLNFKDAKNKTYSAIFVPDSLTGQDYRRLRVRVRVKS